MRGSPVNLIAVRLVFRDSRKAGEDMVEAKKAERTFINEETYTGIYDLSPGDQDPQMRLCNSI
jgi:hypothetical protein